MTVERIAGVAFWIVIASAAPIGQQRDDRVDPRPNAQGERVVVRTYPLGGLSPSRTVETRRDSGGREVVTETIENPDPDGGKLRPTQETTAETIRTGPNAVTTRDVFGFGGGQRMLLETTRSERQTLPDGTTWIVDNTSAQDVNGRLALTSRQIQQTRSSSDVKQTDIAVFRPGINEPLGESERMQQTERRVNPDLLLSNSTLVVRDVNGRFQPTETRSREVRTTGPSAYEEETIQRLDADGKLALSERNVTRRFEANGQRQMVVETFSSSLSGGLVLSDNRLELSQRVRRTTTSAADGGGQTVEEVEERVPNSPSEPMRMVRRTVETIRKVNAERWETERHVYVLDANGRLVLTVEETGATGK